MTRSELLDLHRETCESCLSVMDRKNQDYADEGDPLANFKASAVLGIDPGKSILVRSLDKFKRIQSFIERGDLKVEDEPVEDAIEDVINYMILLKALLKDRHA